MGWIENGGWSPSSTSTLCLSGHGRQTLNPPGSNGQTRSGMTHSQVESCYVCDRDNHTDVCDDIVRLSRWTQPHSRWQSCSNVPRAHFRYSLSQNPLKASYFAVVPLGLNSDRNERVYLCGCQCQWPSHWVPVALRHIAVTNLSKTLSQQAFKSQLSVSPPSKVGVDRYVFFRADTDTDYYRSSRPITDILNRYTCLV